MPAILLNGTSSAGKTSIAKAIQELAPEPFMHVALDSVLNMMPWEKLGQDWRRGIAYVSQFHRTLPILLSGEFPAIIDHVFEFEGWYEECMAHLEGHAVLAVGVHCPVDVLRQRENARGDRRIGLAESQLEKVHRNVRYDLELDTALASPQDCATAILEMWDRKALKR